MSARLDVSRHSVVVFCTLCPSYIVLVSSVSAGHVRANEHERNVHPELKTANSTASRYFARHADAVPPEWGS